MTRFTSRFIVYMKFGFIRRWNWLGVYMNSCSLVSVAINAVKSTDNSGICNGLFQLTNLDKSTGTRKAWNLGNSADYDQTAPEEQSDLGLHCLLRQVYGKCRRS